VRFSRSWEATGPGPYGLGEVYDDETYGKLPPLPERLFTGTFDWLTPEAAGPGPYYMAPNPVRVDGLDAFNRRLARHGLALPAAFALFMASSCLQSPCRRARLASGRSRLGWWPAPSRITRSSCG
jgi:hypothetical protein